MKTNMVKLKILLAVFTLAVFCFSADETNAKDRWTIVEYNYSTGAVSPEYYYTMKITINRDRTASITYSTSGRAAFDTKTKDFRLSRNNFNRLNAAINRSRIMRVTPEDMKYEGQPLIGGHQRSVTLTVQNVNPNLDQPPRQITTPQRVKEQYSKNLNALYDLIENIIPSSVLNEVKQRP